MLDVIQLEASSGFRRLAGARLSGTLRVKEAAINTWLQRIRQVPPGLTVDVGADNRLAVRYGPLKATAVLDEAVDTSGAAPRLRLALASGVLAWALRPVLSGRAVFIEGRHLTIDLAGLDAGGTPQRYWPLVRQVRLRTTPGQIHVEFDAGV